MKIAIIGAGLTGATIARLFAVNGHNVEVYEKASYPGGLAYDYDLSGTMVSHYGPHIFHTVYEDIWNFANKFGNFIPIKYKVQALTRKGWLPYPINRESIIKVCNSIRSMKKEIAAGGVLKENHGYELNLHNYETKALKCIGNRLYKTFVKDYDAKFHGRELCNVLPELFDGINIDENDHKNYFYKDTFVGFPKHGFTRMIEKMLNHSRIIVSYNHEIGQKFLIKIREQFDLIVSTASPDSLLNYRHTIIPYHKSSFTFLSCDTNWPTPTVKFCIKDIPFINGVDYKRLHKGTNSVVMMEMISESGDRLYPIRSKRNIFLHQKYVNELKEHYGVISVGRLGSFKQISMAQSISQSITFVRRVISLYNKYNNIYKVKEEL